VKVAYIAGPFTAGTAWEIEQNIRRAEEMALKLWRAGVAAICVHSIARFFHGEVAEVDALLRAHGDAATRVFETHPELAFVMMNGGKDLKLAKKVKSRINPPGLDLRRGLLTAAGIPHDVAAMKAPKGAGDDDLIDALACLVTARRIHAGLARPHPAEPPRDEYGLPMAIWA